MSVRPLTDPQALSHWETARDPGDPFGHPEYLRALDATGARLALATGPDGSALILARRRRAMFDMATVPPVTPFTPMALQLHDEASVHAGTGSIGQLAASLPLSFSDVLIHIGPEVTDLRPLQWTGWTVEPRYTYRLQLEVAADPDSWSSGPRRIFRQNQDAYEIREASERSDDVIRLNAASYDRHGRPPPLRPESLQSVVLAALGAGLAQTYVALDDAGSLRAGIVLMVAGSTAYYWLAGSDPGASMTVLIGKVLAEMSNRGVRTFDFVGANTPSVAEFKRRFRPDLVTYHAARMTPSRAMRLARAVRRASPS